MESVYFVARSKGGRRGGPFDSLAENARSLRASSALKGLKRGPERRPFDPDLRRDIGPERLLKLCHEESTDSMAEQPPSAPVCGGNVLLAGAKVNALSRNASTGMRPCYRFRFMIN